jgi:hypothetical protein
MATSAELRIEAARLRDFLGRVSDPDESAAIGAMIDELECRAKGMDNGDAAND